MKDFFLLLKNLKKQFHGFKRVKVAVLGDTSIQFLVQAFRGMGYEKGYDLDIWESDYDQVDRQVFDTASELYEFKPEHVIIFRSSHKLLGKYNKLSNVELPAFASQEIDSIKTIFTTLSDNLNANIIYYNYTEINDSVFGNFANKTEASFIFQLRKLNYQLMLLASEYATLNICDISTIQNHVGKAVFYSPSIYVNSEMVLSIDVLPEIASRTVDIISVLNGKIKKCLILDLDNTIWGGIIGDDGLEKIQLGSLGIGKAFTEFQYWIKKLKNRGIIIAVCSKNSEHIAKEPFEKHPDMVLHLEDIAVFIANWGNKVDNIRQIQNILNIGFDSMVFIDDNPFERNMVRENIADICVPELPEDPADYLEYLYSLNLFETNSFSSEDEERTKLYQIEAKRSIIQKTFANEEDYLKSLNMISRVEQFSDFNIPRVAQLSQRSNQFNLRTVRYSEAEIKMVTNSENHFTFAFTLEDKFGDNGLICVIILHKENKNVLFIDTWFMSCRVLKRGMENFALNEIVNFAKEKGFKVLKGEYIPTMKNEMVKDHYRNLGFENSESLWILDLVNYEDKKCFISKK
jgi:FkbH-like protein